MERELNNLRERREGCGFLDFTWGLGNACCVGVYDREIVKSRGDLTYKN